MLASWRRSASSTAFARRGTGPADVSPVGHAANLHLDLACHNFGIQEQHVFNQAAQDVFPGTPEIRDGALWSNDRPGLGVEIDEDLAARFPLPETALWRRLAANPPAPTVP